MIMLGSKRPLLTILSAALVVGGVAGAASAKVLKSAYYPLNWSFSGTSGTTAPVPLAIVDGSNVTVVTVKAPSDGLYSLTFSAECSVDAGADNTNAWVDLDIVVNGKVVPATESTSDSFCSADGKVGLNFWQHPSVTVAVKLDKGKNDVSVTARLSNGATGGWISNSVLVIDD
jgi:hypothetical protein